MMRPFVFLTVFGLWLAAASGADQATPQAPLKLFINEVQPSVMAAPQFCTLVFADHRFHSEKADIKGGHDTDRRVYEGQLSDNDWNALIAVIDSQAFRDLNVPRSVAPLVMQDTHPYTISVARDKSFQNMEFLNSKSLKPYETQVKPLLQWWRAFRGQRMPVSTAVPDKRCTLDSSHAIYSQW